MTKGKITHWALLAIGALLVLTTSAFAVTQGDVVRLKQKAARGEAFTPAERRLADEARSQLGSMFEWPSQQANHRPPHNPLDVYIAAEVDYEWIDITEDGTSADIFDDDQTVGPFALGFDFTFYDQTYSQVFMTSNGWAGFQDPGGWAIYFNGTIPDNFDPHATLDIFWDDLYPPSGGEFYYYADDANNRFIMSWINIPHIGTEDELYTFQIVLTPDGNIRYNYQLVTEGGSYGNTTCTVGLENETSTDGIQVCYDGTGLLPVSEMSLLLGQPDGVPLSVEDLAVSVTDHTVDLTWNDPTEDTNGNPVTLTNVQVWEGRPGSGELVATVAPGVETAHLTNVLDGSKVYYVRTYANPYFGAAQHVNAIVGTPSYANDFDTNNGGWTSEDGWIWGVPQNAMAPEPFSVPNAWGTDFPQWLPSVRRLLSCLRQQFSGRQ
ncbi:MAG: fibronectin type III domain-containing protein [bacterium]|nr:fibronectin type III domain-containing protein [bacterium]